MVTLIVYYSLKKLQKYFFEYLCKKIKRLKLSCIKILMHKNNVIFISAHFKNKEYKEFKYALTTDQTKRGLYGCPTKSNLGIPPAGQRVI